MGGLRVLRELVDCLEGGHLEKLVKGHCSKHCTQDARNLNGLENCQLLRCASDMIPETLEIETGPVLRVVTNTAFLLIAFAAP